MKTIADVIAEQTFFQGLDQDSLDFVAGCGRNVHYAAGDRILTQGEPAQTFYLLRSGSVALSFYVPGRGEPLKLESDGRGWELLPEEIVVVKKEAAGCAVSEERGLAVARGGIFIRGEIMRGGGEDGETIRFAAQRGPEFVHGLGVAALLEKNFRGPDVRRSVIRV